MFMGWADWGLSLLCMVSFWGIQLSHGVDARERPQCFSADGLGGKLQRLPTQPKSPPYVMAASSHTGGRHSAAGVDTTGKEIRARALSFSGFAPPQALRTPLLAAGPQLRVAASASSWAWVRVAAALPNHSPSSR
jgi:hypothetical protein